MLHCKSFRIRKAVSRIFAYYGTDSSYTNIPYYFQRDDNNVPSDEVGMGPPSMYDEPDRKDSPEEFGRIKNKDDIRRQGPRPDPIDPLTRLILPTIVTNIGEPREDNQGEKVNKTTLPGARNENNETLGMDPDELNVDPFSYT